jgi:hypothetical protein
LEPVSLHPFDPDIASRVVHDLAASGSPDLARASSGDEAASNRITLALATALAQAYPAFFTDGFGLTTWEARIDRGIGMLMRPPSRLFIDAGLERRQVEAMPIRLDLHGGLMGGAWIPARLIPNLQELLDTRLERMARRLHEAEYDAFAMLGLMHRAATYAAEHDLGLFEAIGVIGPHGEHLPGVTVIVPDRKQMDVDLLRRIEIAIVPPKKQGLISRILGRHKELPDSTV